MSSVSNRRDKKGLWIEGKSSNVKKHVTKTKSGALSIKSERLSGFSDRAWEHNPPLWMILVSVLYNSLIGYLHILL